METTEGHLSWTTSDMQIEWCRAHGLKVLAGPLLLLDPLAMPDWLYLFEDDFESVLDFVSALVARRSSAIAARWTTGFAPGG